MGVAGEKFSKFFFDPNELKSLKTICLFVIFFLSRVGGWVGQILNRKFYYLFFEPYLK